MLKNKSEYNHGESFMLMNYECKEGHRVVIWNSRDGVTPFNWTCLIEGCDSEMRHVDWHLDVRDPDYQLTNGDWFFRDGTKEDAGKVIRQAAEVNPPPASFLKQYGGDLEMLIRDIVESDPQFQKGWPMLEQYRDVDDSDIWKRGS